MDNAFDDLQEQPVCDAIGDAESELAKHEEWKNSELKTADDNYNALNGLVSSMAELGSTDNPYTTLTPEVI